MKYTLQPYHGHIPDKRLLADLKQTAKRLRKKSLTIEDYAQGGQYHFHTLTRRFGTWNNALLKAGLGVAKHYNIPARYLLDNIRALWQRLGRQPCLNDLYPPLSRYSRRPYLRAFGTWRNALEKFVRLQGRCRPGNTDTLGVGDGKERLHSTKRGVPMGLRFRVMQRDSFRCVACGAAPATDTAIRLHVDHILAWDRGGETVFENLQTLCAVCNIGKGNREAA